MPKKSTSKKRAPFTDRITNRLTKFQEWIKKTLPRLATAPSTEVADGLGEIDNTCMAVISDVKALRSWAPPSRSAAFTIGDSVVFKPDRLAELVKAGFYKKSDLDGQHKIEALNGRKVKLAVGVFQTLYVSKSA